MNIDKYIDWVKIWDNEINLDLEGEYCHCLSDLIKQFQSDTKAILNYEECSILADDLCFVFSEQGGQNESDTQGWSRDYFFTVNSDFQLISAKYEQG